MAIQAAGLSERRLTQFAADMGISAKVMTQPACYGGDRQ
jgi:hypothetical protein